MNYNGKASPINAVHYGKTYRKSTDRALPCSGVDVGQGVYLPVLHRGSAEVNSVIFRDWIQTKTAIKSRETQYMKELFIFRLAAALP